MLEWVVIISGATWRVSSLLHTEDVFHWLRRALGVIHDDEGMPIGYPNNIIGTLFECFWCTSLWIAFLLSLTMFILYPWWQTLLIWLASATGAVMIEYWMFRSRGRGYK